MIIKNNYFISDTHFGHAKIIKYCNRPFSYPTDNPDEPFLNVEEMNETLIRNWNETVNQGDMVYHVGDFAMGSDPAKILRRLNGNKILVRGNHDKRPQLAHGWSEIHPYLEITIEKQFIVLCHYAMRVWNKHHHGSWMLYGHSHGTLPDDPTSKSIDVGVDCHDYRPVSFEEIGRIMAKKTTVPKDHHGR